MASTDVREILNWRREPVLSADGEALDIVGRICVTASDHKSEEASSVKGVFHKSGQVHIELYDKLRALLGLIKRLDRNMAPQLAGVTPYPMKLAETNALDVARKDVFLLAAAKARGPMLADKQAPHADGGQSD